MYEVEKLRADVKDRTAPVVEKVQIVAKNPHAQVTAASAAAGGVAVAVPCGTIGLVGGAVVGFVPAIFTFGFSIPVFAALGGGAAGYGIYTKKAEIRQGAVSVVARAKRIL